MSRSSGLPTALVLLGLSFTLRADASPILHERIPPDPRDDLAMGVVLDGNLPAAIETPGGVVTAPDPRRPVGQPRAQRASGGGAFDAASSSRYVADTDTRRPDVLPYDEPFTPSTAPFKRLVAFDAVDASYHLIVQDPVLQPLAIGDDARHPRRRDAGPEDHFFADVPVSPGADHMARVPSVGPAARVVHARYGVGARDVDFQLFHDGADNWFIKTAERGRLVMELAIPREVFGGAVGDPFPGDLRAPRLPAGVLEDANRVALAIGIDRTSPRRTIAGLVSYFRSFADSDEPPRGHGNVYLDLALSRKGVCRHRAFAFTVTALGLGIPARMVLNEAHAWVEVYDGILWRRIDLGGAGRMLDAPTDASVVGYQPPPDPYAWPPNAGTGEDLGHSGQAPPAAVAGSSRAGTSGRPGAASSPSLLERPGGRWPTRDEAQRAGATTEITMQVADPELRRKQQGTDERTPLHVRGAVQSGGEACARATVELVLRDARGRPYAVGPLATDAAGVFSGELQVPAGVPAGDYDVVAHVPAATRCAEGFSQ